MVKSCNFSSDICYGRREMDLLLQLSDMLSEKKVNLDSALEILCNHLKANRVILTVCNRDNGLIKIGRAHV